MPPSESKSDIPSVRYGTEGKGTKSKYTVDLCMVNNFSAFAYNQWKME